MKKIIFALLCLFPLFVVYKALPITREKESFCSFFPKERFQIKLQQPIPRWMEEQLERDFKNQNLTLEALAKTFQTVRERGIHLKRYRIYKNRLYKFVPPAAKFSRSDSLFEKAFKTLLLYAPVPDCEFLLCAMDGVPEPYMPKDFYLVEDPKDQAPILAQAKLREPFSKSIILIPDQFSLSEDWFGVSKEILTLNREIPWGQKRESAIWRGSLTDGGVPSGQMPLHLEMSPRFKLSLLSRQFSDRIDAGFSFADSKMIAFLEEKQLIKNPASKQDQLFYKYLPVLDGHMCTYPGYQWRLLSNSVAFKQDSDQIQWFYGALQPYRHFIPIRNDMSDLLDQIAWASAHDEEVKRISCNARKFALHHLMPEAVYLYLYLVFKKYASCQKIDFKKLNTESDPQWKCIQYRKRLALYRTWDRLFNKRVKRRTYVSTQS